MVCPWMNAEGKTINHYADFSFALYPRKGGHAPELDNLDKLIYSRPFAGALSCHWCYPPL